MVSQTSSSDFSSKPGSSTSATGSAGTSGSGAAGKADLETQMAKLREDVAGISEAVKSMSANRAEGMRGQAYALRDDVRDAGERYMRQAQDAASDLEDQLSERVRSEPIKSLFIAAAVGYLYARLFR